MNKLVKITLEELRMENSKMYKEYFKLFKKMSDKVINGLFWLWFYDKFEMIKTQKVKNLLKETLSISYGTFFFSLTKHEKDVYLERMPFILSFMVIKAFYDIFPASRLCFTMQFAMEIFHVVFEEIQGISISNNYIKVRISKIFKSDPFTFLSVLEADVANISPKSGRKQSNERSFNRNVIVMVSDSCFTLNYSLKINIMEALIDQLPPH